MSKLLLINTIDALWICYFPKQTCSANKWNYSESKNKNPFFFIFSPSAIICTLERNAIHRSDKMLFVLCDIDDVNMAYLLNSYFSIMLKHSLSLVTFQCFFCESGFIIHFIVVLFDFFSLSSVEPRKKNVGLNVIKRVYSMLP